MKEWILAIFIIALAFILLSTLDNDPSMQASVKTTEGSAYKDFGVDMLQKLDGGLYYDQTTGIVYFGMESLVLRTILQRQHRIIRKMANYTGMIQ